jgi:hypothetical protein
MVCKRNPKTQHVEGEQWEELSELLAIGLMRALARKSSPKTSELGEVSLDISEHQSGHPLSTKGSETHG